MPVQVNAQPKEDTTPKLATPWVVVLYNCDCHTFDDVILQLQKATGCSLQEAELIAEEAHMLGRAIAFSGEADDCERVATVLRSIGLQVETGRT
ncbi:MAG TPA: ATP-dependent Clp protease adaptor ClpS [Armatimonadota bacterium]|jgi:ATP-dependent Clp protease adapter protein ClpS